MINWKLRLNPTTVAGIISNIVGFAVMYAGVIGVKLPFTETTLNAMVTFVVGFILLLANLVAVLVDPTTEGLDDSYEAMTYEEPRPKIELPDKPRTTDEVEALMRERTANPSDRLFMIDSTALYYSDEQPTKAVRNDVWIDKDGAVHWYDGDAWHKTKSLGAIYEGNQNAKP